VHEVVTARGGYIDARVPAILPPGWTAVRLTAEGSPVAKARIRVVDKAPGVGLVCDVDDTIMITALPRPLLAFWNTFVRQETRRRPVPGMADFLDALINGKGHGDGFIAYLSTGPWNVAPALESFRARQGLPPGPFLLTDWGPTTEGWFRSGREHKRSELRRLLRDLPQLHWVLVGDDGQHDPELYEELAVAAPDRITAIAIRQLTPAEQVLTHGTPEPPSERPSVPAREPCAAPVVRAPDGRGLLAEFRQGGLVT
jgi:phosphatidate phosphatase APP1